MVYIKKITIIFLSFVFAFLITDTITTNVLGFPKWGVEKQIYGVKPYGKGIIEIFEPYSRYFNFENGYKVFNRNNLGLTGIEVDTTFKNSLVFILGDSYIESTPTVPEKLACSVLQSKLKNYAVLNLAFGGADPYIMYFQSMFYNQKYIPKFIVLILSNSYQKWLDSRYKNLDFSIPDGFGQIRNSWKYSDMEINLCNHSSFCYMMSLYLKSSMKVNKIDSFPSDHFNNDISDKLISCLKGFHNAYGNKFILLSISDDINFNENLSTVCTSNNIYFKAKNVNRQENKLFGTGHLNETGNAELGQYLSDIINSLKDD